MTSGSQQPPPQLTPALAARAALISQPRLAPYLAATGGHVKRALQLYRWNMEVSGAAYEVLHAFEVILRNAMDQQLCIWNATQTRPSGGSHRSDWLLDPSHLLERIAGDDIARAKPRAHTAAARSARQVVHGDVLAQLTMGTWRYLLPSSSDSGKQLLWSAALVHAFPHLQRTEGALVDSVDRVYKLRNRVAHLEPLLRTNQLQRALNDTERVLGEISPHARQWVAGWQQVSAAIARRP